MVLADQVRRAVAWVYDNAAHLGMTGTKSISGANPQAGTLPPSR